MAEQQRVILYGDTLVLAGVQASLSVAPNLEIFTMNGSPADLEESLHKLHPSAVIFDLDSVQPDFPMSILQLPGLLLIGVDPNSNKLLVLSIQQERAMAAADLLRVIHREELGERAPQVSLGKTRRRRNKEIQKVSKPTEGLKI